MKRNFTILIGAIVMLFAVSSCQKLVQQSDVYEIEIDLISNADGSAANAIYRELAGKIKSTDAVLVYGEVDDDIWMALPAVYDGDTYTYAFDSNGNLLFEVAYNGYTWTQGETMVYRIIIVPKTVLTEKKAEGVDHNNYNEVMRAYNLYEGNVIMKK
ncbi:MAG: hypothetical protein IK025_00115 [Bacteroidales bacterium]|nr:hypothetical protein [Bacteroidales bacterium]